MEKPNLRSTVVEDIEPLLTGGMYHCVLQPSTPMAHKREGNWDSTSQQEPRGKPQ